MDKKFFLFLVVLGSFFLAGCLEGNNTGYSALNNYSGEGPFDDPNSTYYDTGNQDAQIENAGNCGFFEGPCCEWFGTDAFGTLTGGQYCNDGLECRADTCVEGPEYESAGRPSGYN